MSSAEATIVRDEPVSFGGAAGMSPDQGGIPTRTALLSPMLRRRLSDEADWALPALGAAGIAVFARTPGDRLEVLRGLKDGETVIANPGDVREGMKVDPVPAQLVTQAR